MSQSAIIPSHDALAAKALAEARFYAAGLAPGHPWRAFAAFMAERIGERDSGLHATFSVDEVTMTFAEENAWSIEPGMARLIDSLPGLHPVVSFVVRRSRDGVEEVSGGWYSNGLFGITPADDLRAAFEVDFRTGAPLSPSRCVHYLPLQDFFSGLPDLPSAPA